MGLGRAITLGALQRVRYMKQKVGQLLAAEGINGVKRSEGVTTVSARCSACAT